MIFLIYRYNWVKFTFYRNDFQRIEKLLYYYEIFLNHIVNFQGVTYVRRSMKPLSRPGWKKKNVGVERGRETLCLEKNKSKEKEKMITSKSVEGELRNLESK